MDLNDKIENTDQKKTWQKPDLIELDIQETLDNPGGGGDFSGRS